MNDKVTTINELKKLVTTFITERDWNKFHSPKNMVQALALEVSELSELFLWDDCEQSKKTVEKKRSDIEDEIADVVFWALEFCAQCNIDLSSAMKRKMVQNIKKYPTEKCKGKAIKYTELE